MSLHVLTLSTGYIGFGLSLFHSLTPLLVVETNVRAEADYKIAILQSTALILWTLLSSGLRCSVFVAAGF